MKSQTSLGTDNFFIKDPTVKTRYQVAHEYGIHVRTLHRWIKKHGLDIPPGLLLPIDQQRIYDAFGAPVSNNTPIYTQNKVVLHET